MSGWTIIGAGGFIGGRLTQALRARGEAVYAPSREDRDLFERDLGRVFYCAGLTGDFAVRPFDTVEAHVTLLAQVLAKARFERLIYLSSTRLYDSLGAAGGGEDDILAWSHADTLCEWLGEMTKGERQVWLQAQGADCGLPSFETDMSLNRLPPESTAKLD